MKNSNVCKFPVFDTTNDLSVSCFVLETDPSVVSEKKKLNHQRMILVEHGEGEFIFDGKPCPFSAGTLVFGFEGEVFYTVSDKNVRYFYIDFFGIRGEELLRRFGIYSAERKRDGFNGVLPFVKDCLLSTLRENVDVVAQSVLLYVFSRLSARDGAKNSTVQRIIDLTEEHFRSPDLSISFIADIIGYNPKYLSHFFKEKMNVSYGQYLRSYRLRYAVSLFELGISSVKNVALLSGFSDPLYFSSIFKKETGLSPREFITRIEQQKNTAHLC